MKLKIFLFLLNILLGLAPLITHADAISDARIARCPEGQYSGPGTGAKRFYKDPYVWFVSKEFATRFCMPDSYIDETLKGALGVAVLIKPMNFPLCGMWMGRSDICSDNNRFSIEIYLDSKKTNLPMKDPRGEYYAGVIHNSGWLMGTQGAEAKRRRQGGPAEIPGELRPFWPQAGGSHIRDRVHFKYMGVRDKWATGSGVFMESYYRREWSPGIDLLALEDMGFGFKGLRNPDLAVQVPLSGGRRYWDEEFDTTNPIQKWAIGVIDGEVFYDKYYGEEKNVPYPSGYAHVIELPHRVAKMIYAFDQGEGTKFFGDIKNAMQPKPVHEGR